MNNIALISLSFALLLLVTMEVTGQGILYHQVKRAKTAEDGQHITECLYFGGWSFFAQYHYHFDDYSHGQYACPGLTSGAG